MLTNCIATCTNITTSVRDILVKLIKTTRRVSDS